MKIALVSYINGLSDKERLKNTLEILNNSKSDFILFSGHTIGFVNDIESLRNGIKNKKTQALFELQEINSDKIGNCLYLIKNGTVLNLFTNQLFATSQEINYNYELGSRLINELELKRKFKVNGLNFLVLQCGELNILKNLQSQGNKVQFRLIEDSELTNAFEDLIQNSDIILNPIHSPMGNQGKMKKRREFLTDNNRSYFSVSNTKPDSLNLELNGLQYAYKNSLPLEMKNEHLTETYIIKEFEI